MPTSLTVVVEIYSDKKQFIESELTVLKKKLTENLDRLPNQELPFMENHLRALYYETYMLMGMGFYNAGLTLSGILLEAVVKERLYLNNKEEKVEQMNFGDALEKCEELHLLSPDEGEFLMLKKNNIRNPYSHFNIMKLSKGTAFLGGMFHISKLKEVVEKQVNEGLTNSEAQRELLKDVKLSPTTPEDFRPLAIIGKSQIEEREAINVFLETNKFVRAFALKYFKPSSL